MAGSARFARKSQLPDALSETQPLSQETTDFGTRIGAKGVISLRGGRAFRKAVVPHRRQVGSMIPTFTSVIPSEMEGIETGVFQFHAESCRLAGISRHVAPLPPLN